MNNEMTISKNSNETEDFNNNENEMPTEKRRFTKIIQTHLNYLVELRQQKSAKLLRDHRQRIINTTNTQLYFSFLDKCITYDEFEELRNLMRDMLSWENITGVKQLSIFDETPLSNE